MRRRSLLLSLVAGAAVVAVACSTDDQGRDPTGPTLQPTPGAQSQPDLVLRCRDNGLIVVQLAGILSPKAPQRLLQRAIEKFALVELALLQRKKPLAQTRALDLIQFLIDNRANLINAGSNATAIKLGNVIDALLCLVSLPPTGVSLDANTGVGIVPANNPTPVIIRTPQGEAGIKVPIGGAPTQDVTGAPVVAVVVTVKNLGTGSPLNTPLDKFGITIDLNDSQDVQWQQGGVTVAICITEDLATTLFDRLRIGHETSTTPNRFGAIEILPPPTAPGDIGEIVGGCSTTLGFRSPLQRLGDFAGRMLLPDVLHAAAAVKTGGVGGLATRFSNFQAVDPELDLIAQPASTSGVTGSPVAVPPSVLIRTKSLLNPIANITVQFSTTPAPGTISPASVVTGANGIAATSSWVLANGTNTATATAVPPVSEMRFTPPSVTFTAQGAPGAPDFGAADWSFHVQASLPENNSWTTLPWPVTQSGWAQATAPFGSVGLEEESPSGCDDQAPTDWPINTVILLRRDFFVPAGTSAISISVRVDNDVRIFLNGTEITDGLTAHEGCAEDNPLGPFTVTASGGLIPGGVNRLAVLGNDRGTESYVDVSVD